MKVRKIGGHFLKGNFQNSENLAILRVGPCLWGTWFTPNQMLAYHFNPFWLELFSRGKTENTPCEPNMKKQNNFERST